jgi:hypothetical protein
VFFFGNFPPLHRGGTLCLSLSRSQKGEKKVCEKRMKKQSNVFAGRRKNESLYK